MQPYLAVLPSILAVISAFVALVIAQFFRDNTIAKIILVVLAALCGAGAIAATIYNQNRIERARVAEHKRQEEIREGLGQFIEEGQALMVQCGRENEPAPEATANDWAYRAENFLSSNLGKSYVARFRSSAGLPLTATSISDQAHSRLWGGIYSRVARLEQFSEEARP